MAVGMRVDEERDWLVVAGGATGHAYVYDTVDGSTVADLVLGPPGTTFSNDVAVTSDALYFTLHLRSDDLKVPVLADGTFGATVPITVTGPRCGDRRLRSERHRRDEPRLADRQSHHPRHPRPHRS